MNTLTVSLERQGTHSAPNNATYVGDKLGG